MKGTSIFNLKTVWYWWWDRYTDQSNRKENSHMYGQLIFERQKQLHRWKTVFSTYDAGKLDIHRQKNDLKLNLTFYTKITPKWVIDLNIKYKTMKLFWRKYRTSLGLGEEFLNVIPKVWSIKEIHKLDLIKAKKKKKILNLEKILLRVWKDML